MYTLRDNLRDFMKLFDNTLFLPFKVVFST